MPVSIVQVMNNTTRTLHYYNRESGHGFDLDPKPEYYINDGLIPCSNYYDDQVPSQKSGQIAVKMGDGPNAQISDDNLQFCIAGFFICGGSWYAEDRFGPLDNGGKYILRLDEFASPGCGSFSLTFLLYEDQFRVTRRYIDCQSIQHAVPAVTAILMDLN